MTLLLHWLTAQMHLLCLLQSTCLILTTAFSVSKGQGKRTHSEEEGSSSGMVRLYKTTQRTISRIRLAPSHADRAYRSDFRKFIVSGAVLVNIPEKNPDYYFIPSHLRSASLEYLVSNDVCKAETSAKDLKLTDNSTLLANEDSVQLFFQCKAEDFCCEIFECCYYEKKEVKEITEGAVIVIGVAVGCAALGFIFCAVKCFNRHRTHKQLTKDAKKKEKNIEDINEDTTDSAKYEDENENDVLNGGHQYMQSTVLQSRSWYSSIRPSPVEESPQEGPSKSTAMVHFSAFQE